MQSTGIRVRFETRQIAPNGFPAFPYAASVLTHATVQYTAIFVGYPHDETEGVIGAIGSHWPDAVVIAAEIGVAEFKTSDLSLSGYVYGTLPEKPTQKKRQWSLKGILPTDNERIRAATPHNPLPSTV